MDYQKNIKAQAYLMTPDQVSSLFKDNNEQPEKVFIGTDNVVSERYFIYKKPLYLVIRIKNEGNKDFFGEIVCTLSSNNKTHRKIIKSPKNSNSYMNYVIDYFFNYISDKPGYLGITTSWENIYVESQ